MKPFYKKKGKVFSQNHRAGIFFGVLLGLCFVKTDESYGVTINTNLIVTQVYYNGGEGGSAFENDFVEFFNNSDVDIVLHPSNSTTVYKIGVNNGSSGWNKDLAGVVPKRGYFLVQYRSWVNGPTASADSFAPNLPVVADYFRSENIPSPAGMAASGYGAPENDADFTIIQFVDFTSGSLSFTNRTLAIQRKRNNDGTWKITGNDANDFQLVAPDPHNSAYSPKTTPVLSWGALANITYPASLSTNQLNATSSVTNGTFTYALTNGANVTTNTVLPAGTNKVVAFFAPTDTNAHHTPSPITNTLVVNKGNQTIIFGALPDKVVGNEAFSLTATSGSALPISYSSSDTSVATVTGSNVTVAGKGTTTITASQAGNSNWSAAVNVPQTLTVKSRFAAWGGTESTTSASVGLYAIGGASNATASPERPSISSDGVQFTLTAIVRTNDPKLLVVGEASTNLGNTNGWFTNGITSIHASNQTGVPAGHARRMFSISPTNQPSNFLRLKSTLSP